MIIVGAGFSGLIAGCLLPRARIIEAGPCNSARHKALLRFRSDVVAKAVGIDFKKVRVHKGIFYDGEFVQPSIRLANEYSMKVLGGRVQDRSIWNLDAVDRWIAPDDFYERLLDIVGRRVQWATPFDSDDAEYQDGDPIISTAPMPFNATEYGLVADNQMFSHQEIRVMRCKLDAVNTHQTVYFPELRFPCYRASITGDTFIAEFIAGDEDSFKYAFPIALNAFGLSMERVVDRVETVSQRFGKITPIDEVIRRRIISDLTIRHNMYSLGRFATWRNILLDDIVQDIAVIKRLIHSSHYEIRIKGA